jgi:hypothetical protein
MRRLHGNNSDYTRFTIANLGPWPGLRFDRFNRYAFEIELSGVVETGEATGWGTHVVRIGENGETYKRIIAVCPGQKAVIASGFVETDEVHETQKPGAGRYIKKPLTLKRFGMAIKGELEK